MSAARHGELGNSTLGKLHTQTLAGYSTPSLKEFSELKILNVTAHEIAQAVTSKTRLRAEFTTLKIDNPANGGIGT